MSDQPENPVDEPISTYSNIEYYDSVFDENTGAPYSAHIQEIQDSGLVIEENTIYEIDPECYRHLARKRMRKL